MGSNDRRERHYYTFPSDQQEASPPILVEVGGKALSLIEASAANFSVPPGLVLTVAFFESWLDLVFQTAEWKGFALAASQTDGVTKAHCDAVREACKTLALTSTQKGHLEHAIKAAFGEDANSDNLGIVAVRSSSPEEDLAGTSFAGGYDTTLGVTSDTLQDALIGSFASCFDYRIVQYKEHHGIPIDAPRIAIIIQRQIASDVSGVGFSINPSNNSYDEIMISANLGLGESVVSGIITPDNYIVDRFGEEPKISSKNVAEKTSAIWLGAKAGNGNVTTGGTREEANKDPTVQALTDERILEVANLVARVEEHRSNGTPVDIEWAYHDGKLYLLQARPVTAYIPLFPEMVTDRGDEKRLYLDVMVMTQGFSDPLSVLGLDIWKRILAEIKSTMSTEGASGLVWNIHGRQFMNLSNTMKMTGGKAMINKAVRSYDKAIDRAFASIEMDEYVPSVVPEGAKGILWKTLVDLWKMLPAMIQGIYRGDQSMVEYIQGSVDLLEKCRSDECSVDERFGDALESLIDGLKHLLPGMGGVTAGLISRAILHRMFSRCDGANDHLISLCMDLNGNPTSEMGHAMVRLAAFPEIQQADSAESFVKKVKDGSHSDEFMSAYNEFLKKFGCRGIREIDVATPRTYENEEGLFHTLSQIDTKNNQINNVTERRNKAYEELLKLSKKLRKEKKFKHHAQTVQSLLGYREHPKYLVVVIIDRMRRHALKIGKEFVSQGRLESVDQIFCLDVDQITEAQKRSDMLLLPLIKTNMASFKKVAHVKTWPMLIDSRGKIIQGIRQDVEAGDGTLLGDPISPGVVKGKAKVLMAPYQKPLNSGEILVARFTEPSWTPLFINAAGVVMEIGGPMQHGAIIAREYGIPCVSGLTNATALVKDGDVVEVDGSTGTVKILESEDGVKV